jgi:hypothetical protein
MLRPRPSGIDQTGSILIAYSKSVIFIAVLLIITCKFSSDANEFNHINEDSVDPPTKCETCTIFARELSNAMMKIPRKMVNFLNFLSKIMHISPLSHRTTNFQVLRQMVKNLVPRRI